MLAGCKFILPRCIIDAVLKDVDDKLLVVRMGEGVDGSMRLNEVVNQFYFSFLRWMRRFKGVQ